MALFYDDKEGIGRNILSLSSNVIIRLTHVFVCANSTLNFFIYYANGKRSVGYVHMLVRVMQSHL